MDPLKKEEKNLIEPLKGFSNVGRVIVPSERR
jgi:hypothetical protein